MIYSNDLKKNSISDLIVVEMNKWQHELESIELECDLRVVFDEVFDDSGEDAFEEGQANPKIFRYGGAAQPRSRIALLQRRSRRVHRDARRTVATGRRPSYQKKK